MKRFLVCVVTVFAFSMPSVFVCADEDDAAGRVRLSDDPATPPPIPSIIGDGDAGQATTAEPFVLPQQPQVFNDFGPGGNIGYRISQEVFNVQYRMNRRFGGMYGYDDGFTDFGMFIPRILDENTLFFYDLRGFVTDNRDGGFNFGFGRRTYNEFSDSVLSNGIWLDYDGGHFNDYFRLGYSGSYTTRYWRYRWNAYYVASDDNDLINTTYNTTPSFQNSRIVLDATNTYEAAYSGFDATIGGPIPLLGQYGLNWDLGMYYNGTDNGKDGVGFLARADAQLTEDVNLAISYSDDAVFGANASMNLAINFPDGPASRILRQPRVHDYMLRSDERNYRVSTRQFQNITQQSLINSGTPNPLTVAHIDPSEIDGVTPAGDGTIENPFNSLAAWEALSDAQKSQYHIILVQPGLDVVDTNGTYQSNLNTGITIGENQRLLSSTGRLVRTVESGNDVFRYAGHSISADVPYLGNGLTFTIPGTDALAGLVYDPTNDPRPLLSNHVDAATMLANPTTMFNVVSIDENILVNCNQKLEVSGFLIDGWNPNADGDIGEPMMYNNGIVSLTDVSSFDINSNFITNTVHGIDIVNAADGTGWVNSLGEAEGRIDINQIEGAGFYSNSGIHVVNTAGTLNLAVQDNVVYHIYGEDVDNNGTITALPTGTFPTGTEDLNGNGKLDPGEDFNGDNMLTVTEDNDKDNVDGDPIDTKDSGIGIRVVADNGTTINSIVNDVVATDGTVSRGFNISRNRTNITEAELGRDVNMDIEVLNNNIVDASDTDDTIGNKNGMSLEALNAATFNAIVDSNDTSFNNPYAAGLLPPRINPSISTAPTALGNEFGFRALAQGVNSNMNLLSPSSHLSNSNFGHGATLEARDGGTLVTVNPVEGSFTTDINGDLDTATPSQYNDNGLNGMRIYGDNNSSLSVQIGDPDSTLDHTLTDPADELTRVYNASNQFLRNGQDGDPDTVGNGIEVYLRSGATFAAASNSGIFHNTITDNADSGILIDVEGTTLDDFTIFDNVISGNAVDGIYVSALDTPINDLMIIDNQINNNAFNGINYQLLNSNLNNPVVMGNNIFGNGNLIATNPVSEFDIDVVFGTGLTASQQAIFALAAARWEELIIGDLPDVGAIDDVQISASGVAIDGAGGILGQAGPTGQRAGSEIPFQGIMQFDTADLANLEQSGQLQDVILHEMGHVLGIGTIWTDLNLLINPSNGIAPLPDTRFTGAAATAEYNARFNNNDADVPVENNFGPGTRNSHWRENIFGNELMTGFLNAGSNPISRMTTASLQDLGYVVNLNASDPYIVGQPASQTTIDMTQFVNYSGPVTIQNGAPQLVNLVSIDPNAQGNGINFSVQNSNLNNVIIEDNIITDSTNDGIRMINPQFATNNPGDNSVHYRLNTINNNGGYGINTELNNMNNLDVVICANDISGNTLGGINVELSDNAVYNNGIVLGDEAFFGNTINNNGGIGYHVTARDNSDFSIVGSPQQPSTINGNQDAGIGIEMFNNSTGRFEMDNVTINNNLDDNAGTAADENTNFDGEGVGIVLRGNSTLDNARIGDPIVVNPANPGTVRPTSISGNRNNGIYIETFGTSSLQETLIANTTISNNGTTTGGDGINVTRNGSSIVGDDANLLPATNAILAANLKVSPIAPLGPSALVNPSVFTSNTVRDRPAESFVIRDSIINNNGGDGIHLTANLANINDEYLIEQNDISGNGFNGINLFVQGDAEMYVDIRSSTINDNGLDGIFLSTNIANGTDEASITGSWLGLQLDGNGSDGIHLAGIFGDLDGIIVPLQIGSNFTEDLNGNGLLDAGEDLDGDGRLDSDAVFITNNEVNGINVTGSGFYTVQNALIDGNGGSGLNVIASNFTATEGYLDCVVLSNNDLHGVNILSEGLFNDATLTMTNSLIDSNVRDGMQLNVNPGTSSRTNFTGSGFEEIEVTLDTNVIANNGGRGIDHMVQGDGASSLEINNIIVDSNGEQGIYNLVTASTTQDNEVSADDDLAQDGSVFANAFMNFSINADPGFNGTGQNQISNNSLNDSFTAGGLVFRVGTTGALQNFTNGFQDPNTVDPTALGGLVASIQNTDIVNNNGVDFWINTFTSTVDPATTGGTWTDQNTNPRDNTNDVFAPTGYQQDPLARIRIDALSGLTGGSADVLGGSFSTASNQNHAFYDNAEAVFKSRTQNQDNNTDGGLDDDGPFGNGSAGRPRNATRLASRTGFTLYDTTIAGVTTAVAGAPLVPDLTIIDPPLNSDNFLYPGLGISTMQISAGADLGLAGFTTVITDFGDEVGFTQGSGLLFFRDVNYLWQVFP